ncbi:MAG TPA: protease pro-enzyme activation domain-containing protein, partial [Candidatus Elarobacter sp.]|nr:protease pro-enzyme activation domain-containing protein [Candidatus Elarobacter sp.]
MTVPPPQPCLSSASARQVGDISTVPLVGITKPFGAFAYADLGRRPANAPVAIALTLRYNHQAELDQLVAAISDPHSSLRAHFLTSAQFNARYAPTTEQEQSVVHALQAAGFAVTRRFANRTIVDASAPSATVERFFSTEMHTVRQSRYGERYVNLRTTSLPSSIAPLVRDTSLSNVVVASPTHLGLPPLVRLVAPLA